MTKIIIIISIGLFFLLFTWWAILDIAYKDFGSFEKKLAWGFVACIPFIGCIVYLLFGYSSIVHSGSLANEPVESNKK